MRLLKDRIWKRPPMRLLKVLASLALVAFLAAAGLGLPVPARAAPQPFGEQIEVNVVTIEVYVTDRDGRPVTGLQRKDFTLLEDGKPMDIVNFDAIAGNPAAGAAPAAPASQPAAGTGAAAAPPSADGQHLAIFIDNTFLRPAHRNRAVGQIRDFLAQGLAPADKVMVVTQDPGLHVRLPFTTDRAALDAALAGIESLAAPGAQLETERRRAVDLILTLSEANSKGPAEPNACPVDIAVPVTTYAEAMRQEVLRSIKTMTVLVNSLAGMPGRKALLHVSDGLPLNPGEDLFEVLRTLCGSGGATAGLAGVSDTDGEGARGSSYQGSQAALDALQYATTNEFTNLAGHANAQRVTFYTLQASGVSGAASADAEIGPRERVLQLPSVTMIQDANLRNSLTLLASETGGRAIFDANDLRPDLARIQQDFGSYYSLGYSPPHLGDGRQYRIEVRVKQPGVRVRHRLNYRDKPLVERAVDRTLTALLYGREDNPLQIGLELGDATPGAGSDFTVPVRLRIPLFKVAFQDQGTEIVARLRLFVATGGTSGKDSRIRQVEIPIRVPREQTLIAMGKYYQYEVTMTLSAGEQKVAVTVRDEGSALTSYLVRTVQVWDKAAR
jgi:VWFA-related protein